MESWFKSDINIVISIISTLVIINIKIQFIQNNTFLSQIFTGTSILISVKLISLSTERIKIILTSNCKYLKKYMIRANFAYLQFLLILSNFDSTQA